RDARSVLEASQSLARPADVGRGPDRAARRMLEERAVPAAAHESSRLRRAELAGRRDQLREVARVVNPRDGKPVVVEGSRRASGGVVAPEQAARVQGERKLLAVQT